MISEQTWRPDGAPETVIDWFCYKHGTATRLRIFWCRGTSVGIIVLSVAGASCLWEFFTRYTGPGAGIGLCGKPVTSFDDYWGLLMVFTGNQGWWISWSWFSLTRAGGIVTKIFVHIVAKIFVMSQFASQISLYLTPDYASLQPNAATPNSPCLMPFLIPLQPFYAVILAPDKHTSCLVF
jgi:hypothetical protein